MRDVEKAFSDLEKFVSDMNPKELEKNLNKIDKMLIGNDYSVDDCFSDLQKEYEEYDNQVDEK